MKTIEICLVIIAVADILMFIKIMVDFVLALHFRKTDQQTREEWDKTIKMVIFQISELKSRINKLEKENNDG